MIMEKSEPEPLLRRHPTNPILTSADWPYEVNSVFNAGAVCPAAGETVLLCRVEDRSGRSHLCAARSADGVGDWEIDREPTLLPDAANHPEETWGIEDPRVVWLEELGKYGVCYTAYSEPGPAVSLALTEDFHHFERIGNILPPENKDAGLLPHRVDGRWAMLHRPVSSEAAGHIWIAYSPDLRHWGDHKLVLKARRGSWWDARKIGLSAPPIETATGWLMIYHSVRSTVGGAVYRVGLSLLDLENPSKCLLRSDEWVLSPEAAYERSGDVGNVVFPCGACIDDDGDTLRLYYGAADTSVSLVTGSVARLLKWLQAHGSVPNVDR